MIGFVNCQVILMLIQTNPFVHSNITFFNNSQIIEYDDGTPATQSQLAKDVCTYLVWAASPEHDMRKKMSIKVSSVEMMLIQICNLV